MTEHKITPPPELVQQWMTEAHDQPPGPDARVIATQAARWGADQELEACLLWVGDGRRENLSQVTALRAARRPKPASLKEQALHELNDVYNRDKIEDSTYDTIRRALKALPE